jgi:hypothetical protein
VNRLLRRDGDVPEAWGSRLDAVFGSGEWRSEFYRTESKNEIFDEVEELVKQASFDAIDRYLLKRLREHFRDGVADQVGPLNDSKGTRLFSLAFAASNARGAPIAKRIAEHLPNGL